MTLAGGISDLVRVLRSERVVAPLLVLTLLVCHGVFGGMHQTPHLAAAMEHSEHVGFPVEDGLGKHEGGMGGGSYAAALVFILTAGFLLFVRGFRRMRGSVLRTSRVHLQPIISYRSRDPTGALLQVFRL